MDKRQIITLCGSTRFKQQFEEVNKQLTLRGDIVLSVGVFGHQLPMEEQKSIFANTSVKENLDQLHLDKIDMSDAIMVINVDGYIGHSTQKEINYANKHNKTIYYLEPQDDNQ